MSSLHSNVESLFRKGLEAYRLRGIDALPLMATALMQLYADSPEATGLGGAGDDAYDDPSTEARFQLGYAFSVFIERMGHDNRDQIAIEHLNIREECLDAANFIAFQTYAHGQQEAFAK